MSGKYGKIKPDFIKRLINNLGLKSRGDDTKIANEYFRLFETTVSCSKENEDNYRKKVERFKCISPIHKRNKIKNNTREQQSRCLIYACLLVYIKKFKDTADKSGILHLISKIPYEHWKKNNFDLFPTHFVFSNSFSNTEYVASYTLLPEEGKEKQRLQISKSPVSISLWDIINSFGRPCLPTKKELALELLATYCENQYFDNGCLGILYEMLDDMRLQNMISQRCNRVNPGLNWHLIKIKEEDRTIPVIEIVTDKTTGKQGAKKVQRDVSVQSFMLDYGLKQNLIMNMLKKIEATNDKNNLRFELSLLRDINSTHYDYFRKTIYPKVEKNTVL